MFCTTFHMYRPPPHPHPHSKRRVQCTVVADPLFTAANNVLKFNLKNLYVEIFFAFSSLKRKLCGKNYLANVK